MQKFLEVRNNKTYYDDELPDEICRELIRIDSIYHVYIILSDETALCIEYKTRKGQDAEVIESFECRSRCHYRFNVISGILTERK